MIDTLKLAILKRVSLVVGMVIIFLLGFGFGQTKRVPSNMSSSVAKVHHVKEGSQLSEKWVKSFLVAYYTKKDLEENRNRYQPYMTEGLYNATVSTENEAQNQTYKGYVVHFKFQSARIYIDAENKKVIAYVDYTNDLLQKKNSSSGAQMGVSNHTVVSLSYIKVKGKYLVNSMSTLLITDSSQNLQSGEGYASVTAGSQTGTKND